MGLVRRKEEEKLKARWSIYCANSRNDLNAVPLEPAVCKRITDQRNKGHTKGNDEHFECVVGRGFRARWMELLFERSRVHCLVFLAGAKLDTSQCESMATSSQP
jgi:hypothetical protein